jgi:hypothetical protein
MIRCFINLKAYLGWNQALGTVFIYFSVYLTLILTK